MLCLRLAAPSSQVRLICAPARSRTQICFALGVCEEENDSGCITQPRRATKTLPSSSHSPLQLWSSTPQRRAGGGERFVRGVTRASSHTETLELFSPQESHTCAPPAPILELVLQSVSLKIANKRLHCTFHLVTLVLC